ncbi:hypothetical protein J6590_084009 [Homalodisca vitripennis]|nr:hypothetical protein J6590_084009 [Homalodisca vitripennis]
MTRCCNVGRAPRVVHNALVRRSPCTTRGARRLLLLKQYSFVASKVLICVSNTSIAMEGVPEASTDGLFVNDEEYAESQGSNGERESDVDESHLDGEIEPGNLQSSDDDDDVHIPQWNLTTAGLRNPVH